MNDVDKDDDDDDFVATERVVWLDEGQGENNHLSSNALERTIHAMQHSHVCVHPGHYHSFQQVNFMMPMGKCAGCDQGLPTIIISFGGGNDTSKQVVRCVACGAVAHRRCALSSDLRWSEPCPVNAVHLNTSSGSSSPVTVEAEGQAQESLLNAPTTTTITTTNRNEESEEQVSGQPQLPIQTEQETDILEESWCTSEQVDEKTPEAATRDASHENEFIDIGEDDDDTSIHQQQQQQQQQQDQETFFEDDELVPLSTWTQEGPPQHWASNIQSLPTITFPASNVVRDGHGDGDNDKGDGTGSSCSDDEPVHVTPLHYANHPFASISRALQENVIAHFRREKATTTDPTADSSSRSAEDQPKADGDKDGDNRDSSSTQTDSDADADSTKVLDAQIAKTVEPEQKEQNAIVKFASGTYEAVMTSVNMPRRIGAVAVAGGIAGGVAGLAIAGPAGAFAGYKVGQTCGALGVILEGSVSIGVFVASIATAGYTAQQIQEQIQERRILTMGEDGTTRKVLLVRPNIQIDPVWDQICSDARRNAPKPPPAFSLYPGSDAAKARERHRRDSDIVTTAESEIPTTEKVLLLVSRMLNDKSSLPGHVYRYLIEAFKKRCKERDCVVADIASIQAISPRGRRDDAHAVIKHVTAALLEVRPGFAASPAFTELTAAAVETLVFGQLYSLVFDEIVVETKRRDTVLREKIEIFEKERPKHASDNLVSDQALDALRLLPEGHSAVDKLAYCVRFLELISEHFSFATDGAVCADSLLKMACQHILAAKLDGMNAQVAFLEEFARDAQLLRGREGYALVTLQASLHFLNMSIDMEKDIFGQDDDEDNVPVVS
jgi:hypothetical protein